MAGTTTIHGIKNCDTMKKARAWLDARGVAYAFHDYKAAGIDRATLARWVRAVGWETLLNRAGTTFRKLPDSDKAGLTEARAIALMLAQPSMIKRPVLVAGGRVLVGFKPESTRRPSRPETTSDAGGPPTAPGLNPAGAGGTLNPRSARRRVERVQVW
ncbi:MAG: ArsC family reductase [Rhodospirillales bacterium]|nr:MAG: ArsC family reductase [Rhodospirillales bacterium]